MSECRLCYIDEPWAYFSDDPEQTGDGWHKVPYEHNAGRPYGRDGATIRRVLLQCDALETPAAHAGGNSRYSVEAINKRHVPWLTPSSWHGSDDEPIFAGVTVDEFMRRIREAGGTCVEEGGQ
jgi:hypothetical protein